MHLITLKPKQLYSIVVFLNKDGRVRTPLPLKWVAPSWSDSDSLI
uniref:Uncharacterized protein n=1 Tax=Anguilla anguilla TaxID=7936 RepID=A0A0E9XAZ5_ANGAN